jgi:hypothetical protein
MKSTAIRRQLSDAPSVGERTLLKGVEVGEVGRGESGKGLGIAGGGPAPSERISGVGKGGVVLEVDGEVLCEA